MTAMAGRRSTLQTLGIGMAAAIASLAAVALIPQAPAQDLGRVLHAITEPDEARRYEEQAHRNGRPEEERYWHQYGEGLR